MPKRPTQRERVLAMLKQAGSRGVTSNEFYAAHMPRFAARIHELIHDGHGIWSRREGNGKRYWYRPVVVRVDMDPEQVYRRQPPPEPVAGCPFGDPSCPCQDGDPCHYVDHVDEDGKLTPAMPPPSLSREIVVGEHVGFDDQRIQFSDNPEPTDWSSPPYVVCQVEESDFTTLPAPFEGRLFAPPTERP